MQHSRSYWSYFTRSSGRHGVHSPFVFQLTDEGLTTKVDKNFRSERKKWFRALIKNNGLFPVTDLGVGSGSLQKRRSVRQLFAVSSSRGIYGNLLYKLTHYFKPGTVLELGTSIGIGTVHLKKGYPASHIVTVEGCDNTLSRASQSFDYWKLGGITTVCASFNDFLRLPTFLTYDLVFMDGHHDGKATLHYLELLQDKTHDETLFILDDIRWSDDMWEAWKAICNDPAFHVTIDMGRMGLAWKRPQQVKEHFTLRPGIFKTKLF